MTASQILRSEAAKRILIKDGPYGTAIQAHKLQSADYCGGLDLMKDQKGNNDLLNLTRPELVRSICEAFAEAGADVLATNTFNANRISQADYGAEELVGRINRAAAEIVRDVADRHSAKDGRPLWVAGALGPTNKTLSLSPDVNDPAFREVDFDQVKAVYREQIDGLVEGGVDFILIETVFDTLNAKAAIMIEAVTSAVPGSPEMPGKWKCGLVRPFRWQLEQLRPARAACPPSSKGERNKIRPTSTDRRWARSLGQATHSPGRRVRSARMAGDLSQRASLIGSCG